MTALSWLVPAEGSNGAHLDVTVPKECCWHTYPDPVRVQRCCWCKGQRTDSGEPARHGPYV